VPLPRTARGLRTARDQRPRRSDTNTETLIDGAAIRSLERLSLASLNAIVEGFTGAREGASRAVGLEFSDYRPYRAGDDLRRIDWNAYGRLRELLVKLAPNEGHIHLDLLIDASRSMDYGDPNKLLYARQLAAALGTVGLLRSDTVRVWVLSDGDLTAGAQLDAPRMLVTLAEEVARLPAGRGTDLARSLRAYTGSTVRADLAILISDAMVPADSLFAALDGLASSARSTGFIHVIDPTEAEPPQRGPIELRDRETGVRLELTVGAAVVESYRQRFEQFCESVRYACARTSARYVRAPTDVSAIDVLSDSARSAGLVQL
jgi:uncharacterized protein (DUF58 family)